LSAKATGATGRFTSTKGIETMQLLDQYFETQQKIFEFFGYAEDWKVIPLDDCRDKFWHIDGEGPGTVYYADTEYQLLEAVGDYYADEIYTQCHLPKWVYRANGFTMVCCDPHTDGNKFLRIFDNTKERNPYLV
jgi:hypothetical protein